LRRAYACDGTSLRQHNEPAGNQDVWHHHVHVFPRFTGDELYRTDGQYVDQEVMSHDAAQVRSAYKALED
jgi:histidine triad (HIT) family protein